MTRSIRLFLIPGLALAFLASVSTASFAQEWKFGASLGFEARGFLEDPAWAGQSDDTQLSIILEGEARWRSENGRLQFFVRPWARIDSVDDNRTHMDLREGYLRYTGDAFSFEAGLIKVFWGVTESRHLVDIINQTDAIEDIDGENKLGQPALRLSNQQNWGLLEFFALPGFRERTFPGLEGRFRTPLPVDTDSPVWENEDEEGHLDFAGRWSHFLGNWDIGLSAFHGTGREPSFQLSPDATSLLPTYRVISQVSADVQLTRGAWLYKLEALGRSGEGDTFGALVAGAEYTFHGVTDAGADFGLLAEYLFDGRSDDPLIAPPTAFDNDVFVGGRFAFNDFADTTLLAGTTIDVENGSMALLLDFQRRIGENYIVELEGRFAANVATSDPLLAIDQDDVLTIRLTRYF